MLTTFYLPDTQKYVVEQIVSAFQAEEIGWGVPAVTDDSAMSRVFAMGGAHSYDMSGLQPGDGMSL